MSAQGQPGAGSTPPPFPHLQPPPPLTAAVGAMFGLATCVSAQVREKPDDPLNYFIGGCAAGLTLGARSEYRRVPPHTQCVTPDDFGLLPLFHARQAVAAISAPGSPST